MIASSRTIEHNRNIAHGAIPVGVAITISKPSLTEERRDWRSLAASFPVAPVPPDLTALNLERNASSLEPAASAVTSRLRI